MKVVPTRKARGVDQSCGLRDSLLVKYPKGLSTLRILFISSHLMSTLIRPLHPYELQVAECVPRTQPHTLEVIGICVHIRSVETEDREHLNITVHNP